MKTTLLKTDLQRSLAIANRFVSQRPSLPVLGNVLLSAKKTDLTLMATNLETSLQITIPAKSDVTWEFTIPARVFNEFVVNAKGNEINLEQNKDTVKISFDEMVGSISGIASSEFPKLPEINIEKADEVDLEEISEAVNKVAFAASVDEGKPVLTGILIKKTEKKTIFVATDGYRLAQKELQNGYALDEVIVPAKTLVEALKVANELGEEKVNLIFSKGENQLLLSGENFNVASRLLDGTYPQFQQIIPSKFTTEVSLKRNEVIDSIKAVSVFAKDTGNVVKLKIDKEGVLFSANTAQIGEASAMVSASTSGEGLSVAFNSRFLLEGLSALKSEDIEMNFSGELTPALLKDKANTEFIYIVMPVKVQN
jgi:DNA polymerase-3 subunit beta